MGSPPSNAATKTGVFNETLALSGTGTISGGSSDVGTGYTVTGMTLSDGFGAASNYTIDGSVEGDITRKVVNVSGSRADDGTTAIASSVFDTIETGTGQTLNLSGSATAAQSTPGIGITVNTATPGLTLSDGSGLQQLYFNRWYSHS